MKTRTAVLATPALVVALAYLSFVEAGSSRPKILLSIEPVLVDGDDLHPLTGSTDDSRVELGNGGAFHQTLELEADRSAVLLYKLGYEPLGGERIRLTLERSLDRGGAREALPAAEATISVLETWSTTLYEDPGRRRSIVLRVLPSLRVTVDDEPLNADRFVMRLEGGPLIRYGDNPGEDRVVFRAVNAGGAGLEFGIPGFGVIRVHLQPFAGAARAGWVRGTTMAFELGGQSFQAWSAGEILPEDPARPGKGWILYGALLPASEARTQAGYYGSFRPAE